MKNDAAEWDRYMGIDMGMRIDQGQKRSQKHPAEHPAVNTGNPEAGNPEAGLPFGLVDFNLNEWRRVLSPEGTVMLMGKTELKNNVFFCAASKKSKNLTFTWSCQWAEMYFQK